MPLYMYSAYALIVKFSLIDTFALIDTLFFQKIVSIRAYALYIIIYMYIIYMYIIIYRGVLSAC